MITHGESHLGGDHDGHHHNPREETEIERRARALEALLVDRGIVTSDAIDAIIDLYVNDLGPQNGAKVVAKAWVDSDYRARLLHDGSAAIAEFGFGGKEGHTVRVVANTARVHNIIVCTLCSCYPWPLLGLPPSWYKSAPYRARVVAEPRQVLREFGLELSEDTSIRVWDSSAEIRYLVLPERPEGTEDLGEQELVRLVTRDSMIGTALANGPA